MPALTNSENSPFASRVELVSLARNGATSSPRHTPAPQPMAFGHIVRGTHRGTHATRNPALGQICARLNFLAPSVAAADNGAVLGSTSSISTGTRLIAVASPRGGYGASGQAHRHRYSEGVGTCLACVRARAREGEVWAFATAPPGGEARAPSPARGCTPPPPACRSARSALVLSARDHGASRPFVRAGCPPASGPRTMASTGYVFGGAPTRVVGGRLESHGWIDASRRRVRRMSDRGESSADLRQCTSNGLAHVRLPPRERAQERALSLIGDCADLVCVAMPGRR